MQKYYGGIDYLRIALSWAVVAWHMLIFGKSDIFSLEKYEEHVFGFSDLINFHLLLLAVPTFIFISCFLLVDKNKDHKDLLKKVKKYLMLISFWFFCWLIWRAAKGMEVPLTLNGMILGILITPYYFFLCLLFSLIITFFAMKISTKLNVLFLIISCLILLILPFITILAGYINVSMYQNPLNFLLYPFGAIILSRIREKMDLRDRLLIAGGLIAAGISLSLFEWKFEVDSIFFTTNGFAIPAYTRPSLFFFSAALMMFCLYIRPSTNRVIDFMSRLSLGLYCLHLFFMDWIVQVDFGGIPFEFNRAIQFLLLIAISYLVSILMGILVRKDLISTV